MAEERDAEVFASSDYFKEPVDGYRAEVLPHLEFVFGWPKDASESVEWGV